jgi:GT2 family glycosyltransferase
MGGSIRIIYGAPTYKVFDTCNQSIWSAVNGTAKPDAVVIVDNSAGQFTAEYPETIILQQAENIGVARAWNKILAYAEENYPDAYVLMSNDDLILNPDTIEQFVTGIENNPGQLVYCAEGIQQLNAFSLFACHPKTLWDEVGWFDPGFTYAYHEDNCLAYRLTLAGKPLCRIPVEIKEHKHSATMKSYSGKEMKEHHKKFEAMRSYYIRKYGGLPGKEKYTTPCNSGIDAVTWHKALNI